jgi:hypothetical protein
MRALLFDVTKFKLSPPLHISHNMVPNYASLHVQTILIGHTPPEALIDCDTACCRTQKESGVRHGDRYRGHWTANNSNSTQPPILIMSGVVPKSPDRHVVMPVGLAAVPSFSIWHRVWNLLKLEFS